MSSSAAGPLIRSLPVQIESERPIATAPIPRRSSRKSTFIAVAIAVLMILSGAGLYFGHKGGLVSERLSGSTRAERQIRILNTTEDKAADKEPGPAATQPEYKAVKGLTVLPTEDVAHVEQPHQEAGAKEKFSLNNSPTIGQPSITPAREPWLFPDSSSRYLSATDLSNLRAADLWRARNEIFARKGYRFSSPRGIAFTKTLGNYYRGIDENQNHVYNKMNQYERANVTLIQAIERGR